MWPLPPPAMESGLKRLLGKTSCPLGFQKPALWRDVLALPGKGKGRDFSGAAAGVGRGCRRPEGRRGASGAQDLTCAAKAPFSLHGVWGRPRHRARCRSPARPPHHQPRAGGRQGPDNVPARSRRGLAAGCFPHCGGPADGRAAMSGPGKPTLQARAPPSAAPPALGLATHPDLRCSRARSGLSR